MSENVVKMQPENVGESYRFDADEILEYAKGNDYLFRLETLTALTVLTCGLLSARPKLS